MNLNMWFKEIFQGASGQMSSKRVCGAIGWLVVIGVLLYCTVYGLQAPVMIDSFMWCCMALLGIDSVTSIWKGGINGGRKQEE